MGVFALTVSPVEPWRFRRFASRVLGDNYNSTTRHELKDKVYNWHTGYIGGIKYRTAAAIMAGKHPERVVEKAVERMLPRGPLGKRQLSNLRVYPGAEHPHSAQTPETVDVAAMNPKNSNFKKTKAA